LKKLIIPAIILAAILVCVCVALSGCNGNRNNNTTSSSSSTSSSAPYNTDEYQNNNTSSSSRYGEGMSDNLSEAFSDNSVLDPENGRVSDTSSSTNNNR